ncbi:hemerythrin domain-containing protein [Chitinilyticum piscinae]|uniref:Hemerythrin domain-containing protein n=1 Tax=Chitinilyticum piscinae TaxID=2866724 RepID=A0A8J7K1J1_9NEIS|nr:hemerythrin domain-containing protein [Chitinilyticum piscinae]MBE9608752.1 hemerythrin domain-containing protein [Chitinilyticum piscinae]
MKRSPALIQFSREHHPALVLAKRIQHAAEHERAALMPTPAFLAELESHFAAEEIQFAPALAALPVLAARFAGEHARLRALMHRLQQGELAALAEFGETLAAHVRFEERELFMVLQEQARRAGEQSGSH